MKNKFDSPKKVTFTREFHNDLDLFVEDVTLVPTSASGASIITAYNQPEEYNGQPVKHHITAGTVIKVTTEDFPSDSEEKDLEDE